MPVNTTIQLRHGSSSEWSAANPILASGEPGFDLTNNVLKIGNGITEWDTLPLSSSDLQVYVKNATGTALYKGQVVYINGAQGNNPTITLAIASGESTSSKTLGLLKQHLAPNEFGYVITEGMLEGINTDSASVAGDTIWLSPTISGGVVYGVSNKPSAPYHMVFIGYVLRKQANNGKIYVKIQNGFELQELHNVAISGVTNGQFLQYNSTSGLWIPTSSGTFTNLNVSDGGETNLQNTLTIDIDNFLKIYGSNGGLISTEDESIDGWYGNFETLLVNGTGVSINGHTHTASQITDFNSSVSGLFPANLATGVGTSGYVSRWNGTNSLISGIIFDNGTNVGIGTVSPSGLLDVAGNLAFNTFTEKVVANGNSGTSLTLSLTNGTVHTCTLTGNCTFTMPTAVAGKSFTLFLNSGVGGFTATFTSVLWSDSAYPTITTTANKVDILSFISDGTYWYGSYSLNYG